MTLPWISICLTGLVWLGGLGANAEESPPAGLTWDSLPARYWTDDTGRFRTQASLVGLEGGTVQLRTKDGRLLKVPLDRLSRLDQDYVRRQAELHASRKPAEEPGSPTKPEAAAGAGDWPGFRGLHRDGKSTETGLLRQWPPEGPPLLWKTDQIGRGFSSAAISGGMVYITGDVDGKLRLFAFDLDGKLKWQVEHDAAWSRSVPGARATPTIDGGLVYLLSGNGIVGCYDGQSGQRRWMCNLAQFGGRPGEWGYAESVLIYQNLAVVKPGGPNCIVALNKLTGQPVWSSRGYSAGPEYSSCLAFTSGGVPGIVTGTRAGIVCVDPRNGEVLWANDFAADNVANCPTPAYADGYVFWANGYGRGGICLRLTSARNRMVAEPAWTTRDMVCHHGGYIIHDGHIYGNHEDGWVSLDLKTGQKKWQDRGVGKGSVIFADGMLYLFSERNGQAGLAVCTPDRFQLQGRFQVQGSGPSWAHPAIAGGRLYLRYDTNLYVFDIKAR